MFGKIIEWIGKLHYKIQLDDGQVWERHINQIYAIGEKTPAKISNCVIFDNDLIVDNISPRLKRI